MPVGHENFLSPDGYGFLIGVKTGIIVVSLYAVDGNVKEGVLQGLDIPIDIPQMNDCGNARHILNNLYHFSHRTVAVGKD